MQYVVSYFLFLFNSKIQLFISGRRHLYMLNVPINDSKIYNFLSTY